MELYDKLKTLSEFLCGFSSEQERADKFKSMFAGLGKTTLDGLGNVIIKKSAKKTPKGVIMIDAHADEVGLIVVQVTKDGFLKIAPSGGLDPKVCYGAEVIVLGKKKIDGVVCVPVQRQKRLAMPNELFVDVGLEPSRALEMVPPGAKVLFKSRFFKLQNNLCAGKALDNRAGCAAAWQLLELLKEEELESTEVDVVLSDMEEVGGKALSCAASAINPTDCIVLDTTFGRFWGTKNEEHGLLGKGPMLGVSPVLNGCLTDELKHLARQEGAQYQIEVMGGKTSTNADHLIPALCKKPALVSIPIRYMHSPVEVVNIKDIEETARILLAFIKAREAKQTKK